MDRDHSIAVFHDWGKILVVSEHVKHIQKLTNEIVRTSKNQVTC